MNCTPIADHALSAGAKRNALRKQLLALRNAMSEATQLALSARIVNTLEARLERHKPTSIGAYWPMRGEPDVRPLMHAAHALGITVTLPQVLASDQPMRFIRWTPQTRLREDRYGALILGEVEELMPELLLVPCVGFDTRRFRLGYGGGFYDRTLAAHPVKAWGLAYENCRVADIEAQAHDMPLDAVITETAVYE